MQDDPRLDGVDLGPLVATGLVDPCLIFLETTLTGEIPLLLAVLTASTRESRQANGETLLKFGLGAILKWEVHKDTALPTLYQACHGQMRAQGNEYRFSTGRFQSLPRQGKHIQPLPKLPGGLRFTGAIRFLDDVRFRSLNRYLRTPADKRSHLHFARVVLANTDLEWPSIIDARAALSIQKPRKQRGRRPSLLRRIASVVLGKKHEVEVAAV